MQKESSGSGMNYATLIWRLLMSNLKLRRSCPIELLQDTVHGATSTRSCVRTLTSLSPCFVWHKAFKTSVTRDHSMLVIRLYLNTKYQLWINIYSWKHWVGEVITRCLRLGPPGLLRASAPSSCTAGPRGAWALICTSRPLAHLRTGILTH